MFGFFKNIGTTEWILIAAIGILIFGSKAFISLGRAGGETLREIKKIKQNMTEVIDETKKSEGGVS